MVGGKLVILISTIRVVGPQIVEEANDGAPNEEWWGIVDIERNKKLTYDVVKEIYTKN